METRCGRISFCVKAAVVLPCSHSASGWTLQRRLSQVYACYLWTVHYTAYLHVPIYAFSYCFCRLAYQLQRDKELLLRGLYTKPFSSKVDACQGPLRYHLYYNKERHNRTTVAGMCIASAPSSLNGSTRLLANCCVHFSIKTPTGLIKVGV